MYFIAAQYYICGKRYGMSQEKKTYIEVRCPSCGKFVGIRILELSGTLRYSLRCKNCKQISTVELSDIKVLEATETKE